MRPSTRTVLLIVLVAASLLAAGPLLYYRFHLGGLDIARTPGPWGEFGDFVGGILNPIFALMNLLALVYLAFEIHHLEGDREKLIEERTRHDRAIAPHQQYLDPEFYAKIRAPAYHAGLAWWHLPEPERNAYRTAVVQGWVFEVVKDKLQLYIPQPPKGLDDLITYHFQTPKGLPSLTEHQALTALLRFCTRIRTLIDLKMVDSKLVCSLFADEFSYEIPFFKDLSAAVIAALPPATSAPRWIDDLKQLEEWFRVPNVDMPVQGPPHSPGGPGSPRSMCS